MYVDHDPPREGFERILFLVNARPVKLALAALIILSLLPLPNASGLWPLFAAVFGTELVLRMGLLARQHVRMRALDTLFLAIEVGAFASFVPLSSWLGLGSGGLWALTTLRLLRLLSLLRFARDLAHDVYSILTRREQLQQMALVGGAVLMLTFIAAVTLSQLEVTHDYTGSGAPGRDFLDQLWWAFRQLESGDNLVSDLRRAGPLVSAVSLVLTGIGVFVIAFLIGIGANIVDQVVRIERRRPLSYRGHSLVLGAVDEGELLVREFVRLYAKNAVFSQLSFSRRSLRDLVRLPVSRGRRPRARRLPRVALLGTNEQPPAFLFEPSMRWVVYREGRASVPQSLALIAAPAAKRAILLAPSGADRDADAITIGALQAFRAQNPDAHAFVELHESDNVDIARQIGGPGTFALDVPRFLGLYLCHHLLAPGIDNVYRDLLTATGAEFYTHVFVDDDEAGALRALATQDALPFAELARAAYAQHGVILAGAFLSKTAIARRRYGLIPVDELTPWVNPRVAPDEASAVAAGARTGAVPAASLRGLVAIAPTYAPLRRYASDLLHGRGRQPPPPQDAETRAAAAIAASAHIPTRPVARVAIVGYSVALRALIDGLLQSIPDLQIDVVLGARGDETLSLHHRLKDLQSGAAGGRVTAADGATEIALPSGARLTVHTHEGSDLAGFAVRRLHAGAPLDAAVFLSEPDSADRDARTALRIHRFARALESGLMPRGQSLHILGELLSLERGAHLERSLAHHRCGFATAGALRVTVVSTEQIRTYFMVHSAFVPGITALYDRIVGSTGQELVRFELPNGAPTAEIGFAALLEAFGARAAIPIALGLADGQVRLNPRPDERFDAASLRCVFALAARAHHATPPLH